MNGNMNLGTRLSRLEKGGGGGGSKNKVHVYSTEEKVVGKWLDGSNIYEVTIFGTTAGNNADWNNIGKTIPNVDVFMTSEKGIRNPSEWDAYEDRVNFRIIPSSGELLVKQNISSQNVEYAYFAVIHYTKKS